MCHLQPMPGDPHYHQERGMEHVVECARKDLHALQDGGVDGIMFSNEFSLPYLTKVEPITIAAMGYVIGSLRSEITVPYGVNCLWDPIASLDLCVSVGGTFIREIISGVYASDFGLWNTNVGETVRHQMAIGGKDIRLLYNIVPEAARYLADRPIEEIARSTEFNNRPDAICVSVSGLPSDIRRFCATPAATKTILSDSSQIPTAPYVQLLLNTTASLNMRWMLPA